MINFRISGITIKTLTWSKYMYWQLNKQSNKSQIYWSNITSQIPLFYPLVLALLVFRQTLSPSLVWMLCMKSIYKQKIVLFHVGYRLCLLIHIHQFTMIWENLVLGNNFSCFKPDTTTQKCFQYSLVGSRDHSSLDICIIAFNQHVDSHYSNWYLNS